jgi:hypothetical protein
MREQIRLSLPEPIIQWYEQQGHIIFLSSNELMVKVLRDYWAAHTQGPQTVPAPVISIQSNPQSVVPQPTLVVPNQPQESLKRGRPSLTPAEKQANMIERKLEKLKLDALRWQPARDNPHSWKTPGPSIQDRFGPQAALDWKPKTPEGAPLQPGRWEYIWPSPELPDLDGEFALLRAREPYPPEIDAQFLQMSGQLSALRNQASQASQGKGGQQ